MRALDLEEEEGGAASRPSPKKERKETLLHFFPLYNKLCSSPLLLFASSFCNLDVPEAKEWYREGQ